MPTSAFVYILASRHNGTLYVGVTTNLARRVAQHRSGEQRGFTTRYAVHRLVYFERLESLRDAQVRERQMKKWRRAWKVELLERGNPAWRDLAAEIPM